MALIILLIIFFFYCTLLGAKKTFPYLFFLLFIGCQFNVYGALLLEDVLIVIFLFFGKKDIIRFCQRNKFPFCWSIALSVFSLFLSTYFAQTTPHWGLAISNSIKIGLLPLLLFSFVQTKKDIQKIVKVLVVFSLLSCMVSVMDILVGRSIYLDIIHEYVDKEYGWDMSEQIRFGITRAQAFTMQSVSLGYISMMLFVFFSFFISRNYDYWNLRYTTLIITCVSLIVCCMLSGTRSAILPLIFAIIYLLRHKIFKLRYLIIYSLLFIIIISIFGSYIQNVYDAMINSDIEGGSSTKMRENQLAISLAYFMQSPILGMGPYAIFDIVRDTYGEAILGAESVWFLLLVNQGLLGSIAYLCVYINCYISIHRHKSDILVFLLLVLLTNSLTSTPGYGAEIIICLVLLITKMENVQDMSNRSNCIVM